MTGMVANAENINYSSWEQMTDATGRIYLADRTTGTSKWLWQKWDLNGQVFCVNVLTKERKWPKDMDMALKVAAGMISPPELKAATISNPVRPQYHNSNQFPGGVAQRSYSQMAGNGNNNAQQGGAANAARSFAFRSVPLNQSNAISNTAANAAFQNNAHGAHYNPRAQHQQSAMQQSAARINVNQMAWGANNNTYNTHKQQQIGASIRQTLVRPQYGGAQVGNSWNQQHPYPRSSNNHSGRAAAGNYNGLPNNINANRSGHQNDPNQKNTQQHARFWQPQYNHKGNGNDTTKKPAKLQSKRSGISRGAVKKPTNKHIFRPKPAPISISSKLLAATSRQQHRRNNNNNNNSNILTSVGARALIEAAASLGNAELIAAMHARDFSVDPKGKQDKSTMVTNFSDTVYTTAASSSVPVVGLCEDIEKDYLRLTSAPVAELVRPPRILKLALPHVRDRWLRKEVDYDWVCRQMKSIRQDYKVQHVETLECLETYETHARLALENGDLGEFNTCVAQAQELYKKNSIDGCSQERMDEFAAYRILYNVLVGESNYEQARLLASFTAEERDRPATKLALNIRAAFLSNNYTRFFEVASHRPPHLPLLAFLLYRLIPTIRSKAVAACVAAYAPARPGTIALDSFMHTLAYTNGSIGELEARVENNNTSAEMSDETRANLRRLKLNKDKNNKNNNEDARRAAAFLTHINAALELDEKGDVVVDCKASKARGIRILDHQIGLITHAGGK